MLEYPFYCVSGFYLGLYTASFRTAFLVLALFHWFVYKPWRDTLAPTIEYDVKVPAMFIMAIWAGCALAWSFSTQSAYNLVLLLCMRRNKKYNQRMLDYLSGSNTDSPTLLSMGMTQQNDEDRQQNVPRHLPTTLETTNQMDTTLSNSMMRRHFLLEEESVHPTINDLENSPIRSTCTVGAYRLSYLRPIVASICIVLLTGATLPMAMDEVNYHLWAGIVTVSVEFVLVCIAYFAARSDVRYVRSALFYSYSDNADLSLYVHACCLFYTLVYCTVHWTLTFFASCNPFFIALGCNGGFTVLFAILGILKTNSDGHKIPW